MPSLPQIAKGLITRSDQRGYDAVDQIITLLHDPLLGRDAAAALGIIGDEEDRVLSKENFAVIRVSGGSYRRGPYSTLNFFLGIAAVQAKILHLPLTKIGRWS